MAATVHGAARSIITTGTFLNGLIHCGEQHIRRGAAASRPRVLLGEALKRLGLRGCRLKTGTPPRLDGRTIDWTRLRSSRATTTHAVQLSDQGIAQTQVPLPHRITRRRRRCGLSARTCTGRRCIRGQIQAIGPRYCPSIEDKIVEFPDKDAAPVFSRAGRFEYARGLRERHVDLAADGGAVGDGAVDSRAWRMRRCCGRVMRLSTTRLILRS